MSQEINLLNPLFRKQQFSFTSPTAMVAGIGIVVLLTGLFGVYESTQLSRVEGEARIVAKSLADLRAKQETAAAAPRKADAALEARLAQLTTELKARQDVVGA